MIRCTSERFKTWYDLSLSRNAAASMMEIALAAG
jgi:hypothetical protein